MVSTAALFTVGAGSSNTSCKNRFTMWTKVKSLVKENKTEQSGNCNSSKYYQWLGCPQFSHNYPSRWTEKHTHKTCAFTVFFWFVVYPTNFPCHRQTFHSAELCPPALVVAGIFKTASACGGVCNVYLVMKIILVQVLTPGIWNLFIHISWEGAGVHFQQIAALRTILLFHILINHICPGDTGRILL